MLKVLFVIPPAPCLKGKRGVTGPEVRLREMVKTWSDQDIIPVIFYPETGRLLNDFLKAQEESRCRVVPYIPKKSGFGYLLPLYNACRSEKPVLIHSQGPVSIDLCSFLVSFFTNLKLVVSRTSMISDDVRISFLRRFMLRVYDFLFVRWADRLLTITQKGMAQWENELFYIPVVKKGTVYNGVDLERFHYMPFPAGQEIVFGMIAQLNTGKGHLQLLKVVHKLKEKGCLFKILIVGDGPLITELERYCIKENLNNIVKFSGHVDKTEEVIAAIHVAVLPSLKEGFPVSLLESMACGRPVIASDVGAVDELVHEGSNGFLVQPGDAYSLEKAMLRFLQDKRLIAKMGENAHVTAQRFSLDKMRSEYIQVYRDCAAIAPNGEKV